MTPVHAIMILIIRLWAASAIISSILSLSLWPLFSSVPDGDGVSFAAYTYINGGVWTVLGVLAWVFAPTLAKRVSAEKEDGVININVSPQTLVAIGGFLIGGFYIVEYAPTGLTRVLFFLYKTGNREAGDPIGFTALSLEHFVTNVLVLIAACWLTFRPRDIARFFSKLRRAGLANIEEDK